MSEWACPIFLPRKKGGAFSLSPLFLYSGHKLGNWYCWAVAPLLLLRWYCRRRGRPINPAVGSQHQRQVFADISGGRTRRHFSGLCPRDTERKKHQKKRATKNRARKFTKPNGLHTAQQKKTCRKANCKLGSNSQDPSAARGQSNLATAQGSRILINICHRKRAK